MNVTDKTGRLQQLLIRWILVVLPTIAIVYVTLRFVNFSYTALSTSILTQTLYFTLGLVIAYTLYFFGARLLVTLILLWIAYFFFKKSIVMLPGEFDVFFATAKFELYSTLFIFGWVFGFLLSRIRWGYIVLFGILATVTLASISDTTDVSLSYILVHITPVVAWGLYMLFLSPVLTDRIELSGKKWGKFALRIGAFAIVILLAFILAQSLFRSDLKAVEKELAARGAKGDKDSQGKDKDNKDGYDDRYGLMDKSDDGLRLKDTMRVNTKMSQSDKLMFCSKLENYFDDGSPAPLYYVYHYLTRYDSVRESFTRDVNVPSLDEIEVDPTSLPMYYSFTDTTIFRKSKATKGRKIVEAQVYLSENTWKHSVLGPASVFALQTIPVEKDFQKQFIQGYKIYTYASDLNNAYFVYNISGSPMLEPLQDQRHDELRKVANYNKVDKDFMKYYTHIPKGGIYDSIANLALRLSSKNARPVDKVIAVRDYFLQRNENGKRVFRYSLKAGAVDDPNIPSSKMLYNFLFKTHTGYCTYYAGASHFMLRALGIPTRFTTGFAAVNRSTQNKGWYWFYASQAHAWTQVYFPEYGWLDFDMTIGNEDQQSAPRPDGTPPLPPPEPWLVLNAQAVTVDSAQKSLEATFSQLLYFDKPYDTKSPVKRSVNASGARIVFNNKRDTTFSAIHPGDSVIIVSYKDDAKAIPKPRAGVPIDTQLEGFPDPIVADEIHIHGKEFDQKKDDDTARKKKAEEERKITWQQIAWGAAISVGSLLLLILLFPMLYFVYRVVRVATAGKETSKADQIYRATLYRLHMAGLERETETPLEYANRTVDPALTIGFADFMRIYLRVKYTNGQLREGDMASMNDFAGRVGPAIRKRNGFFRTLLNYFNVILALRYFQKPEKTENENTSL